MTNDTPIPTGMGVSPAARGWRREGLRPAARAWEMSR